MTAATRRLQVLVVAVVARRDTTVAGNRRGIRNLVRIRQRCKVTGAGIGIPVQGRAATRLVRSNCHRDRRAIAQRKLEGLVAARRYRQAIRVGQCDRVGDRARVLVAAHRQLRTQRRRYRVDRVVDRHRRGVAGIQ